MAGRQRGRPATVPPRRPINHAPKSIAPCIRFAGGAGVGREDGEIADQEPELELRSIAVAVRSVAGKAAAAMNIGAHASRVPAPELCAASHELETMLRRRDEPVNA